MKRSSILLWVIGAIIAAIAIGVAFYFDESVRDFLAQHQNRAVKIFMLNVSRFGDWPEHFGLGIVLLAIAWWRGQKRWTRIFLSMLIALALAGLVGRAIKISTGRARPSVKAEELWSGPRLSSKFHAFPSGHVLASSAFFAVLTFARWRIGLPCLAAIPALIGFSRMYAGAHYLSDVVCAAVIGLLSGFVVWRIAVQKSGG
ncbi:MAG TPA: phosphatase PAP2 family protein [Chthoniobacterales bacterium]|nr:phosphatase PAP2 family protein [Chthoniobacterales bacterium]